MGAVLAAPAALWATYLVGNENKTAVNQVQQNDGDAIKGPDFWDPSTAASSPSLKVSMVLVYESLDF